MELTKEYFDEQLKNLATKDEVALLHDVMDDLKANVREIKATVARIDKRDIEDSNAFAKDIVQLQEDVKELKLKSAS